MYSSQKIDDQSYQDIQSLYLSSFGFQQSVEAIKKKYDTSLFGIKNIGFLAKSELNEPAAYYGVFPTILYYEGQDYLVAQSGDTMTAPNHRKKGLFGRLANETYTYSQGIGIKLVFGFPNEMSYPGFAKGLNWVFNGNMQRFTFSVLTIPLCELASKYPFLEGLFDAYIRIKISKYQLDLTPKNLEGFNYSISKGMIKKDFNFFQYKLNNKHNFLIEVDGFKLLVKAKTHLYIGEVAFQISFETLRFTQAIQKLARKLACKKVIITLSKNHWLYNKLSGIAIANESLPIGFFVMNEDINYQEIAFSEADYDTF